MDPMQPTQFAYYASDYSITPVVPLHYLPNSGSQAEGRPVPLTDLFPVFSSSPLVNQSVPVPVLELCNAIDGYNYTTETGPRFSASSLAECVADKCEEDLSRVSKTTATYEALLSMANPIWGWRMASKDAADLIDHFNYYNSLEECAIRHCPTDYFIAHSTLCISLRHPFFTERRIYLPSLPAQYADVTSATPISHRSPPNHLVNSEYLRQVLPSSNSSSTASVQEMDLGIRLPALPAGFPCDAQRTDQSLGTLLPRSTPFTRERTKWFSISTSGTWATADNATYWMLARNATLADGAMHSWVLKSTLVRGFEDLGSMSTSQVESLGLVPVNVYSLGHCPHTTRTFSGSKLSGEPCTTSLQCVFSLCVDGRCAAAASGKQLSVAQALDVERGQGSRFGEIDKSYRQHAALWLWIVVGGVGGLILLRVTQLRIKQWWKRRKDNRQEQPVGSPVA